MWRFFNKWVSLKTSLPIAFNPSIKEKSEVKKNIAILLVIIMIVLTSGCNTDADFGETAESMASPTIPKSTIIPTVTPEPTLTPAPTPIPMIFHRIDNNPAEFAVCVSTPYVANIFSSYSGEELRDTLTVLYLVKDRIERKGVIAKIKSINAYSDEHAFMGAYVSLDIDANQIFISKSMKGGGQKGYFSRTNKKNGVKYYSLFELTSDYENKNSSDYAITNIARFLEVSDNKIYYLSTDGNVYTFEMTTQEIKRVDGYAVIDYDTLPEGIDDYTAEYVLTYDDESKQIDITNISIENGAFVVGDLYQSVDCSELDGKIVDIKAGFDALFITTQQGKTNTIYRYDMFDKIYETLYQTEYAFDCSYVTEDDYFAAFYDGNYHIKAIKYNFKEESNRIIYDGDTCAYWEHVRPNEDTVDEVVEHPRYKDINFMTYKGHMLFGFNIDKDGVTTLVFKSDVIDRDRLPRPSGE